MLFTVKNASLHAMCLKYISKTFILKYLSENVGLGDPRAHLLHGDHCSSQPCHQQVTLNNT